jgi:hypothetical protein
MVRPALIADLLISVVRVDERIVEVYNFVTRLSRVLRTPGFLPRIWRAEHYRRRVFPYDSVIAVGRFIVQQKG